MLPPSPNHLISEGFLEPQLHFPFHQFLLRNRASPLPSATLRQTATAAVLNGVTYFSGGSFFGRLQLAVGLSQTSPQSPSP